VIHKCQQKSGIAIMATLAITPSKPADWEILKPVIENLYLRDNLRLKDVIEVMREIHQFRAT
jgi:hypothetical protein